MCWISRVSVARADDKATRAVAMLSVTGWSDILIAFFFMGEGTNHPRKQKTTVGKHSQHHRFVIAPQKRRDARSVPRGSLGVKLDLSKSLSKTRHPPATARVSRARVKPDFSHPVTNCKNYWTPELSTSLQGTVDPVHNICCQGPSMGVYSKHESKNSPPSLPRVLERELLL